MQNLNFDKINGFLKCKGLKMKNLIFGVAILAILAIIKQTPKISKAHNE